MLVDHEKDEVLVQLAQKERTLGARHLKTENKDMIMTRIELKALFSGMEASLCGAQIFCYKILASNCSEHRRNGKFPN